MQSKRILMSGAAVLGLAAIGMSAQSATEIQQAVDAAYGKFRTLKEGKNADYIPALAKVDSKIYGIALVTVDGKVYTAGDIASEVSIQSISKVFAMAKVMEEQDPDAILNNMGVDATGQVFNSIVAVEQYKGSEMNAMVNPGAITATSMISGATPDEIWGKIIGIHSDCAGRQLSVNQEVYDSEAATNQRNQAISMLMYAYGHIKDKPLQACDLYTKQCAISVNAKDLAMIARRGRIVVIGNRGTVEINPRDTMGKSASIIGMLLFNTSPEDVLRIGAALAAGLENGTMNPIVGREFPLSEASRAHEAVLAPGAHGKIVLIP